MLLKNIIQIIAIAITIVIILLKMNSRTSLKINLIITSTDLKSKHKAINQIIKKNSIQIKIQRKIPKSLK